MATKTESETNEIYNLMRFGRVKRLKICYDLKLFVHLLKPFKTISYNMTSSIAFSTPTSKKLYLANRHQARAVCSSTLSEIK